MHVDAFCVSIPVQYSQVRLEGTARYLGLLLVPVEPFYVFVFLFVFSSNSVCVFITSPVREGSTFLLIRGVRFFQTELNPAR